MIKNTSILKLKFLPLGKKKKNKIELESDALLLRRDIYVFIRFVLFHCWLWKHLSILLHLYCIQLKLHQNRKEQLYRSSWDFINFWVSNQIMKIFSLFIKFPLSPEHPSFIKQSIKSSVLWCKNFIILVPQCICAIWWKPSNAARLVEHDRKIFDKWNVCFNILTANRIENMIVHVFYVL